MSKAFVFGDDIDTDQIIPAQYLTTTDPNELGTYCMAGINPEFSEMVSDGDIIVGGVNFGCGSSREQAPVAIKAAGCGAVVAESFARIFFRNAINIGLPVFEVPNVTEHVSDGDELSISIADGTISNESTGEILQAGEFPPFVREIIDAGGLIEYGRTLSERDRKNPQ